MQRTADRLLLLEVLTRVLDRRSITRAAEDLGISQAQASKLLKELERRFGIELVRRNTHHLCGTAAGLALADSARELLEQYRRLLIEHDGSASSATTLHVIAPVGLGQLALLDVVSELVRSHANLTLRWDLRNGEVAFYREGCDLWIGLGRIADPSLVVVEAGRLESVVVAAPSLLDSGAGPTEPSDLEAAPFLLLEPYFPGEVSLHRNCGRAAVVTPSCRMLTNNLPSIRRSAIAGLGFAVLPVLSVRKDIDEGRLVEVLPQWHTDPVPINLVYAPTRYRPPIVRTLIDHLRTSIPTLPGVTAGMTTAPLSSPAPVSLGAHADSKDSDASRVRSSRAGARS